MAIPTQGEMVIVIQMPSDSDKNTTANGQAPSATNPQHDEGVSKNPKDGDGKSSIALAAAANAALQVGKQALNTSVAQIGLATGNYYQQARVQQTMQSVSTISALAVSAANPITFAVTVAGMAISAGSEYYQQTREKEIANYEAAQYAKRIGYTVDRK